MVANTIPDDFSIKKAVVQNVIAAKDGAYILDYDNEKTMTFGEFKAEALNFECATFLVQHYFGKASVNEPPNVIASFLSMELTTNTRYFQTHTSHFNKKWSIIHALDHNMPGKYSSRIIETINE